jgi:hypothetical protein
MRAATPRPRPAYLVWLSRFLFSTDAVGGFLVLFMV